MEQESASTQADARKLRPLLLAGVAALCVGAGVAGTFLSLPGPQTGGRAASPLGASPPERPQEVASAQPPQPDPFADARAFLERATAPLPNAEPAAAAAPAGDRPPAHEAMLREFELLLRTALQAQIRDRENLSQRIAAVDQRIALVESEQGAAAAGMHHRMDALSLRIGLVGPSHPAAATIPQAVPPAPAAEQQVTAAAAAPARPTAQPPRPAASPLKVVEAADGIALLERQDANRTRMHVRTGSEVAGFGRVTAIRQGSRGLEVAFHDGRVITQ